MAPTYRVYLSSTLKDLIPEREAVKKALTGECILKDSYRARENDLIETCLDDVSKCDIYIGVVGLRYGYCPNDLTKNPAKKSITELEYEKAVAANLARLIFLKDESFITAPNTDSHNNENKKADGNTLISDFRDRVGNGKDQVPALFKGADDLGTLVLKSFMDFKTRREGGGAFFQSSIKHPGELDSEIALLFAAGTDKTEHAAISSITTGRRPLDTRFLPVEISPVNEQYQTALDPIVRRSRALCWVFTPASLSRYKETPQLLESIVDLVAPRSSGRYALLLGVSEQDLSPGWSFDAACTLALDDLKIRTADSLETLYRFIRERCPAIAADNRIGVPCVTMALTAEEAGALASHPETVLCDFTGMTKKIRSEQLKELMAMVRRQHPEWPEGFYGPRRLDWHPFAPEGENCREFLESFAQELNSRRIPGTPESRLLGNHLIQIKHYAFDEFRIDQYGSKAVLNSLRDQGCLVLVDEFALLHPKLRALAAEFLNSQRAAIVSAIPGDPLATPLSTLVDELSHLSIGNLLTRFMDTQDHRVEIAVNNPQRLSRWLRLVLPGLVTVLGGGESRADLVQRPDSELFGTPT